MKQHTATTKAAALSVPDEVKVLAIDLAKDVFQAAGEDGHGQMVFEARIRSREAFYAFVRTAHGQPCVKSFCGPAPPVPSTGVWTAPARSRRVLLRNGGYFRVCARSRSSASQAVFTPSS